MRSEFLALLAPEVILPIVERSGMLTVTVTCLKPYHGYTWVKY